MAIGGYLAAGLFTKMAATNPLLSPARSMLLPGKTTNGHHQIELACESCHATPFASKDDLQKACEACHGADLKAANDSHPLSKFTDPRNADRLEKLEATLCVTCHVEHSPAITLGMGVTLAGDFCFHCHAEIAKDRPSHAGFAFDSCNSAGCHKFHDNRSLYEDFLAKHLHDPANSASPLLPARSLRDVLPIKASIEMENQDAPAKARYDARLLREWHETTHAKAGVNCSGCHGKADTWVARPTEASCKQCHEIEARGFLAGKHGMRLAAGLSPMTPGLARIPMRTDARNTALGCVTCHTAHRFDTKSAAVDACLGCHRDEHSLAYPGSPHEALWKKELAGELPAGSGVNCASCHLPRIEHRDEDLGLKRRLVQHNQNDSLQPNEKMIRPVCLSCHGLGFSIDALADKALVRRNFAGQPRGHVKSLDMVAERLRQIEQKRNLTRKGSSP